MSGTYGSIHIKTAQTDYLVQMYINENKDKPNQWEEALNIIQRFNLSTDDMEISQLTRYAQLDRDEFLVVVTDEWVSFYDEQLSFEEIAKKARSFAKKTQDPIVYTSCFDGDVYVFGLIENGKTTTSGRAVVDPDVYDMTEKQAKMAEFYRVAGVPMPDAKIKMPSDVMELENLLSSIMPVPLIIYDEDDFENLAEEYKLVEEVKGIRIFKVKYKK